MASDNVNYGVVLGDVQDTARVIDAPAEQSGLATGLDALSKTINGFGNMFKENAQRKRQAAADARATEDQNMQKIKFGQDQNDRNAGNAAVLGINAINNNTFLAPQDAWSGAFTASNAVNKNPEGTTSFDDLPDAESTLTAPMLKDIGNAVTSYNSISSAVDQGKMPEISRTAQVDLLFNRLVAKFGPDSAGAIAGKLKDLGVDSALFDELKLETERRDKDVKAAQDERDKAINLAKDNLGPASVGMAPDQLYVYGLERLKFNTTLDLQSKQAQLLATQNSTSQSQYNFQKTELNDQFGVDTYKDMSSVVGPLATQYQQILLAAGEPGKFGPDIEAKLGQLATFARAKAVNALNARLDKGGFSTSEAREAAYKDGLRYIDSVIMQPFQDRDKGYAAASDVMKQRIGLSSMVTAPVIYDLKTKYGIQVGDIPDIMNNLPPDVIAGIKREFTGVGNPGFNQNLASQRLATILAVLKGDKTLSEIDTPAERATVINNNYKYTLSTAKNIANGGGNPDMWMHGYKSMIVASEGLNNGTNANTLYVASNGMFGPDQIKAIEKLRNDPATADDGKVVGAGSRASAAQVLSTTRFQIRNQYNNRGVNDPYTIKINTDGRYAVTINDRWRPAELANSDPITGGIYYEKAGARKVDLNQAPESLKRLAASANMALDHLVNTASWDPDAPKGTYLQVRAYWTQDKKTPDMIKAEANRPTGAGKTPDTQLRGMIDTFETSLKDTPETLGAVDLINSSESSGGKNAGKNPNSSASGPGQFINGTWLGLMKTNRPDLVKGKSDSEILAMKSDKTISDQMTGFYARDNAQKLTSNGIDTTAANISVAHLLGPDAAIKALKAPPNTPLSQVVSPAALAANPWMNNLTVAQLINRRARGG